MSVPQAPKPAKLVIGFILKDRRLLEPVVVELAQKIGPVDFVSPWFPFDFTNYYEKEMGSLLARRMVAFKPLIQQPELVDIKLITNKLETKHSKTGKRKVNIDPGYLLLERFVLATGKNFTHRIFIGKGIYADLTLIYTNGTYQSLPWTYPDYAQANIQGFLKKVREKYKIDLKDIDDQNCFHK